MNLPATALGGTRWLVVEMSSGANFTSSTTSAIMFYMHSYTATCGERGTSSKQVVAE
ncbi:MAG: hypothetical protein M0008_10115 [Actinomycetota bacterium]|nr:hypothetical protein [Actinomycetota bacterium]